MRYFAVGFAIGLAFALWASVTLSIGSWLTAIVVSIVTPKIPKPAKTLLLGLVVGVLLALQVSDQQLDKQFPSDALQRDFLVIGTVISVPKQDERRASFVFRIDTFLNNSYPNPKKSSNPEQLRLSWYGPRRNEIRAGDQWEFLVRLKPPSGLGNPGGFNFARWLFQNRIHATGYVRDTPAPVLLVRQPLNLHAMRQAVAERISGLPSANEYGALVQGLTVGVTNSISREQWQTLRLSGTAHLLAISGLHIGLISGWCFFVAGFAWTAVVRVRGNASAHWFNRPIFALALSIVGAAVYAALAGFSLPTQRALLMLSVFALSSVMRRIWPPGTALLFALFVVLIIDPLSVLSVGFWLSFGTVSALFYLHQGRINQLGKVRGALSVHMKLGVVLLPATAWFFQQGAMLSPIANIVAVPFVGLLVVPLSFIIAVLTPLWPTAANVLLGWVQWLLAVLLNWLDWLLLWPGASLPLFLPSPIVLLCSMCALVLVFSPRALHLRWLCVPLVAPALLLNIVGKPVRGLELHVLDVGQGLAALVFTKNHTLLFDTGSGSGGDHTMIDRVVQPFLVSSGRANIGITVLSHADDDHAGGLDALLSLHPQTHLISSEVEHHTEYNAQPCRAGQTFDLDDVTFAFLHPGVSDSGSRNNQSCVLLIHFGNTRLLLTGDIESESEQLLVNRVGDPFDLDVLVAPHHGSRSSSTQPFIDTFKPEVVVYAAGDRNRFGFPHDDVVERYEKLGAIGYVTGVGGAVSMQFDRFGLTDRPEQYWTSHRRYRRD